MLLRIKRVVFWILDNACDVIGHWRCCWLLWGCPGVKQLWWWSYRDL